MEDMLATAEAPLTLARMWREMTPAQKMPAVQAFWDDEDSMPQQLEAVTHLARQLHFRPQSVLGMPAERKAKQLALQARLPDTVVARVLVAYHLRERRPMLVAFLDQLGIAHEDGLIAEGAGGTIDREKLAAAVTALKASFDAEDVRLYFRTLAVQDPETWGVLEEQRYTE